MLLYKRVPELQIKGSYHFQIGRPEILLCYVRSLPKSCKSGLMEFIDVHRYESRSVEIKKVRHAHFHVTFSYIIMYILQIYVAS